MKIFVLLIPIVVYTHNKLIFQNLLLNIKEKYKIYKKSQQDLYWISIAYINRTTYATMVHEKITNLYEKINTFIECSVET